MLANYATKEYADTTGRLYARQDFTNTETSTLTWTQTDTLIPGGVNVIQVYRNGQILLPNQYTIPTSTSVVIAATSFKVNDNYTVIFPRGGGAGSGGGSGSLTSISGGTGILVSPDPITTTGTVSADLSVLMELTDTSLLNLTSRFNTKQNTLVSGTNIKTVNSNNLLGSGNISVGTLVADDTVSLSNRINTKLTATDTASLSNRINLKLNSADTASLSSRIDAKGNGTVTSVATGYGLSGGTITSTGTLLLDSAVVFSRIRDSIVDVAIGTDTIKILKQEYAPATTSVLTWTITSKFPIQLKAYILVFRNGQLLINDQYNLTDTNKITIVSNSFKVGSNYTVVTVSGIGSVGTGVFPNPVYPEAGIAVSTGSAWASSITNNSSNWNIAFNDKITNAAFSGTTTKTLTLTQYDGGTFTPTFTDLQGVTGVTAGTGLTGGTITSTGTVAVNFGVVAPLANPTFTGTVSGITKSMVGLGNVDNTSDANKPVSTATQTALNLKVNISDTASMLTPYFRDADTSLLNLTSRFAAKLNLSDTLNMLVPYLRKADTTLMLSKYLRRADTSLLNLTSRFSAKLNISDTSNMLVPYLRKADTTLMLSKYLRKADTSLLNLTSRFAAKLNISDTASMLTNYLRSGVAASTYLPFTGGTLTGNLRLASSVGTQLNIDANDNNLESRITFSTVGSARSKIYTTSSVSSMTFESIAQASAKRGFRFISSTEGNSYLGLVQDPQGNVGIKSDATGNDLHPNTLYVNGTLGVTGAITEAGNNVLTNLDTVSLSTRIDAKVGLTGNETISGVKTFVNQVNMSGQMTVSGSVSGSNRLLGKNTSNNGVGDITVGTGLDLTGNNLTASGTDTTSLSNRIDAKYDKTGGTISGAVTLSTTTATPTTLLGKDGSNVVGTVTTVAQTGLMTRGETTATTGSPSAVFTVTHGLGSNPTAVLVTSAGIGGGDKIIFEVYTKNSTTFSVQAWNYDGTEASGKEVKIYWLALK
jgi:hypothetical protein